MTHATRRRQQDDPFQRLEQIIDTFVSLNREAGSLIDRYIDHMQFEGANQRPASKEAN